MKAILLLIAIVLVGCSTSSVSVVSRNPARIQAGQIGMAPGGGELADAISLELSSMGFDVAPPTKVKQIDDLAALSQAGVKTLLIVKSVEAFDGNPQTATIQIISTADGQLIAAINWKNGYGSRAGSISDRVMRSNTQDAAHKIAMALSEKIGS